jgi:threonine dehydrogenase-like Zn-dependent dehydrogenase
MKAVVFHGVGDIRLETVREPKIKLPTDALIRITASAICGTDLHFIRGTIALAPGTVLGHEAVGVIEELGKDVRNFKVGDRVVVPSTIACGYCSYCRAGYQAQCDFAHPDGPHAGTPYYGGGKSGGGFDGLQAEYARIAYAAANLVKLPDTVDDDRAILLSDIFPTAYFGADLAEIKDGDTVVVFGCGPVGQFAVAAAKLHGAGRVFAVDCIPSRLEMAREQGAEVIDFNREDPVEVLMRMTGGIGPDRAIDAVGLDAVAPTSGPAAKEAKKHRAEFNRELREFAPDAIKRGKQWRAGDAPSLVLDWGPLSAGQALPDRRSDGQEPDDQGGRHAAPQVPAASHRPGRLARDRSGAGADADRAARRRDRSLQGVRPPRVGLGEGGAQARHRRGARGRLEIRVYPYFRKFVLTPFLGR